MRDSGSLAVSPLKLEHFVLAGQFCSSILYTSFDESIHYAILKSIEFSESEGMRNFALLYEPKNVYP
jgi:hypothetical protein